MKPGEAIHFAGDLDTQASPVRVVRAFMVVGLLASSLFMLLIVAVPPPVGSSPVPLLACGVLACFHAMLALWPGALSLVRTMHCYVLVVGVAAAVVAAASGLGLALVALGIVPVMLCAAATLFTRALTLSIALTQALLLCALAVAQSQGLIGAAVAAADLLWLLVGHLVLLLAASTVGLLLRGVIGHTVARQRLREQRFVGLLAVAADWYWETDSQLRFTHLSEHAAGGSGLTVDRRLGKAPWEIENFGLDDDAMDAHRADLESHQPFTELVVHRTARDGAQRWLSVSGRPRFDARGVFIGYWGVGRDITDEHEAELARGATELRYRELFARSPAPLLLHRDGRVLDANAASLALFGARSFDELRERSLLDLYDDADGSRARAAQRSDRLASLPTGDAVPPQQFGVRTVTGRLLTVIVTSVKVEVAGGLAILSIYSDETERLRSELARQRSEALLQHLVATSPDLITLTDIASGRYVMVNDAFVALTGYSRDESVGRTSLELNVWDSAEARARFVAQVQAKGEVRDMAVSFRHRDGGEFSLLVSAARFGMEGREYLVLNGRDVTQSERERLERDAILTNASIGIALTRDRHFQLANPRFEQMFGWPPGTLAGQPGEATSVDRAAYEELGQLYGPRLARGEAVELDRTMRRHDGSTFLCRLLARPIDPDHPAKGATIWIAEDVTERRAVEQALAHARDEAEEANRAKSAFLANTSHEIRTPLNGLVGLARLARQPGLDEARRSQYLAQIDDSAQALSGVISDILDLSKIEAGKLRLERAPFDLHALLESVEHGYAALAEARSLSLAMHVAADVPRRVNGDAVRVRQVLSNFLNNALKFTAAGYVRVSVAMSAPERVRFEVEDSGPGIAAEVQSRLFEPFTQADASTTRRYGGTGLGLSICRQLAHLMGGEVGLASEPGRGSRFWAELPLATAGEAPLPSNFGELRERGSPLAGVSLLLVEDNAVNMMIAAALLQQWGVNVSEATQGLEAVAAVNAHADAGHPFDLVLMDVQMPVQGGHDATRVLRQRYAADTLPIIALTAAALTSERDEALAAGMNDFLTKPIDAQRLHDTLLRWLKSRTRRA